MQWGLETSPQFEDDYRKTCARNAGFRAAVGKKVAQVLRKPLHYKPLRAPLPGLRRVHVGGSSVLLFEPVASRSTVRLLRLAHHDEVYGKQPKRAHRRADEPSIPRNGLSTPSRARLRGQGHVEGTDGNP